MGETVSVEASDWFLKATKRINRLKGLEDEIALALNQLTQQKIATSQGVIIWYGILMFAIVGLSEYRSSDCSASECNGSSEK